MPCDVSQMTLHDVAEAFEKTPMDCAGAATGMKTKPMLECCGYLHNRWCRRRTPGGPGARDAERGRK